MNSSICKIFIYIYTCYRSLKIHIICIEEFMYRKRRLTSKYLVVGLFARMFMYIEEFMYQRDLEQETDAYEKEPMEKRPRYM